MNKEFNLSSRDYADILGISTDNLRQRRRREIETNYIQDDKGNYWWKRDRPTQVKKDTFVRPKKNGLSRVPGQSAIDTKKETVELLHVEKNQIIQTGNLKRQTELKPWQR